MNIKTTNLKIIQADITEPACDAKLIALDACFEAC